jgi:hypothetical protein
MELQWRPTAAEIIFAVLLAALPWSFSEMPVIWKCLLWATSWGMILHLASNLIPILEKLPVVTKTSIAVGLTGFLVAAVYAPILEMWKEEKASGLTGYLVTPSDGKDRSEELPVLQVGDGPSRMEWGGPVGKPMREFAVPNSPVDL